MQVQLFPYELPNKPRSLVLFYPENVMGFDTGFARVVRVRELSREVGNRVQGFIYAPPPLLFFS